MDQVEWLEVTVKPPPELSEVVGDLLMGMGATGAWVREGEGVVEVVSYWPRHVASAEDLSKELTFRLTELSGAFAAPPVPFAFTRLQGQSWSEMWKQQFPPLRIGRVTVVPPWETRPAAEGIAIVIDPGMAFGTGQHATTRLCLELLQKIDLNGKRVLDVGTGTGLLAVAAAELGAELVVALDRDWLALTAAQQHARINEAGSKVCVAAGNLVAPVRSVFDIVVANLTAALVVDLAGGLGGALCPDGTAILSGFGVAEVDAVRRALERKLFREQDLRIEGEWAAIAATLCSC